MLFLQHATVPGAGTSGAQIAAHLGGEARTQPRIAHALETGKALRN